MKNKQIKDNILKLIECKLKTAELIDQIYHESGEICLKIYSEDPISIFVENPRGLELLAHIFKKRIMTSDEIYSEEYPTKKYFSYKDVEFFCLYKEEEKKLNAKIKRTAKTLKFIIKLISYLKTGILFLIGIAKIIVK